jgi:hypothetical protein
MVFKKMRMSKCKSKRERVKKKKSEKGKKCDNSNPIRKY